MTGTFDYNKEYKVAQRFEETDTRTFNERHATLPFVREEDYSEWIEWANRTFPHADNYVHNNR